MSRTRSRQQGVIARRSDEELLLLDTVADRIHQLNPTAGFIWEKLAEDRSDAQIAQMLCDEFDVSPDQARADVEATVRLVSRAGTARTGHRFVAAMLRGNISVGVGVG